ncbi:MAG: hypothetical protein J5X23_12995 [Candidatus Accumulibacter sp.]|uniref:hypothetical protein n=1 Tax=Accumulibacter sp. TaxID=2053492 RepID=UPI001B05F2B4|nr:hypothetical protein [Accumulibacter sp.]MBO3715872.1 hypothetical protein [Accumulibacter sp.]
MNAAALGIEQLRAVIDEVVRIEGCEQPETAIRGQTPQDRDEARLGGGDRRRRAGRGAACEVATEPGATDTQDLRARYCCRKEACLLDGDAEVFRVGAGDDAPACVEQRERAQERVGPQCGSQSLASLDLVLRVVAPRLETASHQIDDLQALRQVLGEVAGMHAGRLRPIVQRLAVQPPEHEAERRQPARQQEEQSEEEGGAALRRW